MAIPDLPQFRRNARQSAGLRHPAIKKKGKLFCYYASKLMLENSVLQINLHGLPGREGFALGQPPHWNS